MCTNIEVEVCLDSLTIQEVCRRSLQDDRVVSMGCLVVRVMVLTMQCILRTNPCKVHLTCNLRCKDRDNKCTGAQWARSTEE